MEKKSGFWAEFKTFIARGNVMDMAVGVIIGAAFKAIIDSLVNDIINPVLGSFAGGGMDLTGWTVSLARCEIMIGNFISAILNFLLMALVLFCIIKAINSVHKRLEKKVQEAPAEPPEPSNEEKLLTEIRDLLKQK